MSDVAFADPEEWLGNVRNSSLKPDIITFSQPMPQRAPQFSYHVENESLAVVETSDYKAWWESLPQESRKNVRKSQKRGVRVAPAIFNEALAQGIKRIYDETPIRQGRRFWHYGKSLEAVRQQNSSYLERSEFLGAYLGDELIGFMKFVRTRTGARIMQILSLEKHYDKHPMNAMLAAAVETCCAAMIPRLIYGQYIYGNKRGSSITEFKRRNGFHEQLEPHFYVPVTLKGRIAVSTGLFRTFGTLLPEPLMNRLLAARHFIYRNFASLTHSPQSSSGARPISSQSL